jgi:hypothetical protein
MQQTMGVSNKKGTHFWPSEISRRQYYWGSANKSHFPSLPSFHLSQDNLDSFEGCSFSSFLYHPLYFGRLPVSWCSRLSFPLSKHHLHSFGRWTFQQQVTPWQHSFKLKLQFNCRFRFSQ